MSAATDAIKQKLNMEADNYNNLKQELQKNHQSRQQLIQQQTENEMVLKELGLIGEDANVYKLIGPTLIKQDIIEAKSNVEKRLEYITREIERLDKQLKTVEKKMTESQNDMYALQNKLQNLNKKSEVKTNG